MRGMKPPVQQHQLDKLLHGSRRQEIGKAGDDIKSAEAAVLLAKTELERLQTLAVKKLTSTESVDKAKAQYDEARESLSALKEQYSLTAVGPRREDIQAAQARLKADEAALQLAKKSWEAVKPTVFVLQLNTENPGFSFHEIDKDKEKNFRSVRFNSDIRIQNQQ